MAKTESDFRNTMYPLLKSAIRAEHPEMNEYDLDRTTRQSITRNWEDEPKETPMVKGLKLDGLFKSKERYEARPERSVKYDPAVVVDYYNADGKFEKQEVCTGPMVLKSASKYDDHTFIALVHKLTEDTSYLDDKRTELVKGLVEELAKRQAEHKKRLEESLKEGTAAPVAGPSNWDLKDKWMFGKSVWIVRPE